METFVPGHVAVKWENWNLNLSRLESCKKPFSAEGTVGQQSVKGTGLGKTGGHWGSRGGDVGIQEGVEIYRWKRDHGSVKAEESWGGEGSSRRPGDWRGLGVFLLDSPPALLFNL